MTTGPGGINALTGEACAYLDLLPMIIISGQVRYDTIIHYALEKNDAKLRSFGDQEFNITESVKNMTKFAALIKIKMIFVFILREHIFYQLMEECVLYGSMCQLIYKVQLLIQMN